MRPVFLFVFLVGEQKIDFIVLYEVEMIRIPPHFPLPCADQRIFRKPPLPRMMSPASGLSEGDLKASVIGVRQERVDLLGEYRSFDEVHMSRYTPMA